MSRYSYQPATLDDAADICDLGKNVSEFEVSEQTVTFWPQAVIERAISGSDAIVLVAKAGDELVGFIIANCNSTFGKALIENLYVSPSRRGEHIGQKLIEELLAEAAKHGYEYIATLIPLDAGSALMSYTQAGFAIGHKFIWLDYVASDRFSR